MDKKEFEEMLKKLNYKIDSVIFQKNEIKMDYNYLEKILFEIVKNSKHINKSKITTMIPIKKEEIIKLCLNFFESIDEDLYKNALDIIMQQNKKIKVNIYNLHDVKDFNLKDENGIKEFTKDGSVSSEYTHATVHIPLTQKVSKKEADILNLNENEGSLDDAFTLVHEIAHLFDLNLDIIEPSPNSKDDVWTTREITGECTSIAFEHLFKDYLLKNTNYSKTAIMEHETIRHNSGLQDAKLVFAQLYLARIKEKNGTITRR